MAEGLRALKHHVTALDSEQYTRLPDGVVLLSVTHENLIQKHVELRFDLHMTIFEVKCKIYRHAGTQADYQRLILKDCDNMPMYELEDNTKMLGFYSVESGMTLHVIDTDPHSLSRGGGLEDVSLVKKYRMTDEEYDEREGTLRAWKKEQLKKDPMFKYKHKDLYGLAPDAKPPSEDDPEYVPPGADSVVGIAVGNRCEVQPGARLGTVMWVGEFEEQDKLPLKSKGFWIGVKLDEPVGKTDGTNRGKEYFKAGSKYGAFVRADKVTVGDYPEEDLGLSDSDEEI